MGELIYTSNENNCQIITSPKCGVICFWINVIKVRLDFTVSNNGELNFINVNVEFFEGNCSLVRFAEKYLHGALELSVISFSGRRYCKIHSSHESCCTFFFNRCEHFRSMFQAHWGEDEKE